MKVKATETIQFRMTERLQSSTQTVLLRSDFKDLGSPRQISRGLNALLKLGLLIKIGFGLYAKAYKSRYTDSPLAVGGLDNALREALNRLKIRWMSGSAEQAYNAGETTQIPMSNIVRLKSRCRRKIEYKTATLIYEGNINAR